MVDFKLQSPYFKLRGWSLTQRLLNVAGPTLRSDVVSTFPKQETSIRYDIDYLPEAEDKGQTSLWARPNFFPDTKSLGAW